jgi:hypothetical protein
MVTRDPPNMDNILNRLKNYFSQPLKVHGTDDVRQSEIYTTEPLAPEHRPCEAEIAI